MKSQGYNDRLNEHLAMKDHHRKGKPHGDYKARRHESEGMEKHYGKRKYSGVKSMDKKKY
ncbi:MAG: hypothetical protein ACLFUW_00300 [Bacteroidales bacterium]